MSETSEEKNMQMQKDFAEKIKSTIGIIQQRLQNHGGNIELADVEPDNAVKLHCDATETVPKHKKCLRQALRNC